MTRTALVTGASRGIGLGIAERLAAEGFDLTISARDPERLEETARRLRDTTGRRVVALAGDVRDTDAIAAVVAAHREAYGALSVLVLNAGVGALGAIGDEGALRRFDLLVEANLRAPLHYLHEAMPLLRAAADADAEHGAKVVALSSITGTHAEPLHGVYGATKSALDLLVDTLNIEQSAHGITATAVAPGYVDTDLAAWKQDELPAATMMPVADVAELVLSLTRLTRRTMVGRVVMARSSSDGRRA